LGAPEAGVTVVSVLRLPVRSDSVGALAEAFAELDVFGHSARSGGFRGGRLLRPLEAESPVVVIAEWENLESYRAWLDNPVREQLRTRLEPLLAGDVVAGDLYEEVSV
jgi:heme-degrading monooxygenase HmoA